MESPLINTVKQSMLRRRASSLKPLSVSPAIRPSIRYYSPSPSARRPATPNSTDLDNATYLASAGSHQAYPLSGYYSHILSARSLHRGQATTSPSAAQQAQNLPPPPAAGEPQTPQEKIGIVFGTRLAGPGRSPRPGPGMETVWKVINGVKIPPRPDEPDNCCMSGCVNCVWDNYRDEMEEWAALVAQAKAKAPAQVQPMAADVAATSPSVQANNISFSMDDDGGGSETNWSLPSPGEDLFADIPVGIREFMKTEKRLKQIHRQEAART